jgi:hypothetical protein
LAPGAPFTGTAIIIPSALTKSPKLLAKAPVLLAWAVNDLQLALIHLPGNGDRQKAEWVEYSLGFQTSLSRVRSYGGTIADSYRSVFGPYGNRSSNLGCLTGPPGQSLSRKRARRAVPAHELFDQMIKSISCTGG